MFADKAGQKIFGSGSSRPLSITVVHENQNSFNRQNTGNNRKKDKFSLEWLLPVIITGRILANAFRFVDNGTPCREGNPRTP